MSILPGGSWFASSSVPKAPTPASAPKLPNEVASHQEPIPPSKNSYRDGVHSLPSISALKGALEEQVAKLPSIAEVKQVSFKSFERVLGKGQAVIAPAKRGRSSSTPLFEYVDFDEAAKAQARAQRSTAENVSLQLEEEWDRTEDQVLSWYDQNVGVDGADFNWGSSDSTTSSKWGGEDGLNAMLGSRSGDNLYFAKPSKGGFDKASVGSSGTSSLSGLIGASGVQFGSGLSSFSWIEDYAQSSQLLSGIDALIIGNN